MKAGQGMGSKNNPYIINGLSIYYNGPYLINISNVDVYFQITNCLLTGATGSGIYFKSVTNAQVINNVIDNNNHGIYLFESSNNNIDNNSISNNNYAIYLDYSENIRIDDNIVSNNDYGIYLGYSSNNRIDNNSVSNSIYHSIFLYFSFGNSVSNNIIDHNSNGIELFSSSFNSIENNTIIGKGYGISLFYYSIDNSIKNNLMMNNGLYIYLYEFDDCRQAEVVGNLVNGKPLIYWQNVVGGTIPADSGQVVLVNCSEVTVANQNLSSTTIGLQVIFSQQLEISNNIISSNYIGIFILYSSNNSIGNDSINNNINGINLINSSDNTIGNNSINNNNYFGILLDSSSNNIITKNNFIDNNPGGYSQAYQSSCLNYWSTNYWSDWTAPDDNNDGIVDNSYNIAGNEADSDPTPVTTPYDIVIHFLSPPVISYPTGGETLNGTVTIQWTAANDSLGHTVVYNVYYSADTGSNWSLLASGLTTTSYDWNTTAVADGSNYLVKVNASCTEGLWQVDVSDSTFTISNTVTDHSLTTPEITYPTGGETLNGTVTIQWTAANDSLGHTVVYNVYYSADNGSNWLLLEAGLTTTSLDWDTTAVADGSNYLVKVNASCTEGLWQVDVSDSTFTISNTVTSESTTDSSSPTTSTGSSSTIEEPTTESTSEPTLSIGTTPSLTFNSVILSILFITLIAIKIRSRRK